MDGEFHIDLVTRLGEAFRFEDIEFERLPFEDLTLSVATPRMLYRDEDGSVLVAGARRPRAIQGDRTRVGLRRADEPAPLSTRRPQTQTLEELNSQTEAWDEANFQPFRERRGAAVSARRSKGGS